MEEKGRVFPKRDLWQCGLAQCERGMTERQTLGTKRDLCWCWCPRTNGHLVTGGRGGHANDFESCPQTTGSFESKNMTSPDLGSDGHLSDCV